MRCIWLLAIEGPLLVIVCHLYSFVLTASRVAPFGTPSVVAKLLGYAGTVHTSPFHMSQWLPSPAHM